MKKLIILFAFVFSMTFSFSQVVQTPVDIRLGLELLDQQTIPAEVMDTLQDPSVLFTNSYFSVTAFMTIFDTVNISKIHVKLGTSEGGNDLLESEFLFDNPDQPNGLEFTREEYAVCLGLGVYLKQENYFFKVYLEDINGQLSETITYQTN